MYENKRMLCILSARDSRASLMRAEACSGADGFSTAFPAVELVENALAGVCFPHLPLKFRQGYAPWLLP